MEKINNNTRPSPQYVQQTGDQKRKEDASSTPMPTKDEMEAAKSSAAKKFDPVTGTARESALQKPTQR